MVQELEIFEEENLRWALDQQKFQKLYPEKFEEFMDFKSLNRLIDDEDSIIEIFESDENKFWEVSEVRPMIKIKSIGSELQIITNKDLYSVSTYIDQLRVSFANRFVICCIDKASGQSGALGIWDTSISNWCFKYSDELFCVDSVIYDSLNNVFKGVYSWNMTHSDIDGQCDFIIDSNRNFIDFLNT